MYVIMWIEKYFCSDDMLRTMISSLQLLQIHQVDRIPTCKNTAVLQDL